MINTIKASVKLLLFIPLTLFFLLLVLACIWQPHLHQKMMQLYFKLCLILFGIRVSKDNTQVIKGKSLYVSNHTSYLDIFILGAYLPVKFTPKSDIASWPVVGFIVKVSGAVFIDRRPSQVKKQQVMLEQSFAKGNQLMLFAEGTTNNGAELLPFKSSLFSVAHIIEDIKIIPVLLRYKKLNGNAAERTELDQLAWYADMTLGPHFWNLLKQKSVNVSLQVFDHIDPDDYADRKEIAIACENKLRSVF